MLIKALAITTLLFFSTTALLSKLYLDSYSDVKALKTELGDFKGYLEKCEEDKDKLIESAKQDDEIIANKETELKELAKQASNALDRLDAIPQKTCKPATKTITKPNTKSESNDKQDGIQQEYVDIDMPFDSDFIGVFKSLSDKN